MRSCVRCRPQRSESLWNKGPAIWFPWDGAGQAAQLFHFGRWSGSTFTLDVRTLFGRCADTRDLYEARLGPREGDERLSAKKRSESDEAAHDQRAKKTSPDKSARRQRSTDLGRALRTIYDDTLRETVPDDFLNLIGKLS